MTIRIGSPIEPLAVDLALYRAKALGKDRYEVADIMRLDPA